MRNKKFNFIITILVCLFILAIQPAFAKYKVPKYRGYVNDYAGIITSTEENKLNALILDLKSKTGAEIAVVTLNSLDGYPVEDVALAIGRTWGVGQKDKNTGAVILVAPNDRKMRIEIGYGLEGYITDAHAGRIRDEYMLPYFKQGQYEKGTVYGTLAVINVLSNAYGVEISGNYSLPAPVRQEPDPIDNIITFIFIIIVISQFFGGRRGMLFIPYGGFGGSRGFSGGGGGFGGFGGGGFGGGGASGGW